MKRSSITFIIFAISFSTLIAQTIDVKISPIALFYKKIEISGEYGLTPKNGIEFGFEQALKRTLTLDEILISTRQQSGDITGKGDFSFSKTSVYLHSKFYLKPQTNIDGFNLGIFARYKNMNAKFTGIIENKNWDTKITWPKLILGGTIGYKNVSSNKIIVGFTMGLGYAIYSSLNTEIKVLNETFGLLGLLRVNYFGQFSVGYRLSQ